MGRLELQLDFMDLTLTCSRAMATARIEWEQQQQNNNTTMTLSESLLEHVPCARKLVNALQPYRDKGTSLVFSNEVKSTIMNWKVLPGYSHKVPQDWFSLAALLGEDWNFVLVLGHRPYLDWVGGKSD